jgi:hypothetical protein
MKTMKNRMNRVGVVVGAGMTWLAMGCGMTAQGDIVSAWHFNDIVAGQSVIASNWGESLITTDTLGVAVEPFTGTLLNAEPAVAAGDALGVRGAWANGSWFAVVLQTDAMLQKSGSLELSFAYRASATGFDENAIEWLVDDIWTPLAYFGETGDWALATCIIPPAQSAHTDWPDAPAGEVHLRIRLDGASSSSGTIRFDNMRVGVVPGPSGLAGLALLFSCRSRRRRLSDAQRA